MTEADLQSQIVAYLRAVLPHPAIVHHSANKPRSAIAGAREKAMGAVKGWPDLLVVTPGITIALEIKTPRGSLSPEQRAVLEKLRENGIHTAVCRSIEDAVKAIKDAGIKTKEAA